MFNELFCKTRFLICNFINYFFELILFFVKKAKHFLIRCFNKNEIFTVMLIPHISSQKTKTLNVSKRIISLIIISNIIFILLLFLFISSYFSLNKQYKAEIDNYTLLNSIKHNNDIKLDNYIENENSLKEKMDELTNLNRQLEDIINSKSDTPQSSINTTNMLVSRSMNNILKYNDTRYLFSGNNSNSSIDSVILEADLLMKNINSNIEKYNTLLIEEQIHVKELQAIPSLLPVYGKITSPFGYRKNPFGSGYEFHKAIDIGVPYGTPIKATADGIITISSRQGDYGLLVKIDHQNGYESLYAHNSKIIVALGENVSKGQIIAYAGSTGKSTGTHCHFEIRYNGVCLNPLQLNLQ